VVPGRCTVSVDVRNVPEFKTGEIIETLKKIVDDVARKDAEFRAEVKLMEKEETSYTGYKEKLQKIVLPFYVDPDEPHIKAAIDAVNQVLGRRPRVKSWSFATDASCFANSGAVTFGFGPGEERFAHSSNECVKIEDVINATRVYAHLPIVENI
jgi:succinyl-diaminopimelate desuccinylase